MLPHAMRPAPAARTAPCVLRPQAHFAAAAPAPAPPGPPPPAAAAREGELATILGPGVPRPRLRELLAAHGGSVARAADAWFRQSPPAAAAAARRRRCLCLVRVSGWREGRGRGRGADTRAAGHLRRRRRLQLGPDGGPPGHRRSRLLDLNIAGLCALDCCCRAQTSAAQGRLNCCNTTHASFGRARRRRPAASRHTAPSPRRWCP